MRKARAVNESRPKRNTTKKGIHAARLPICAQDHNRWTTKAAVRDVVEYLKL